MSFVSLKVLPSDSMVNSLWSKRDCDCAANDKTTSFHQAARRTIEHSPSLIEQPLLLCNEALVTHRQVLHGYLSILLIRLSNGSFVGLELDDVYNFVWRG